PNEDGYFHVNGSDAEFVNVTNGRKVEISPDGLYGRNANGSIRFQADQTLVTSAALGTSNYNVYLAAEDSGDTSGEVRAVKTSTLGGSGNSTDYDYIDIRARSIKSAYGRHFYIATDLGELRVMSQGLDTQGGYRDIRARKTFANELEVNDGAILYLRASNRVRTYAKGSSSALIDLETGTVYNSAMITNTTNAYVGTDNELRVVNKGLSGIYRDVRLGIAYANAVEVNTGSILYLRSNNRIRATKNGTTDEYIPIQATDLLAPSSRELKDNIRDIDECATDILCELDVVKYDYLSGEKNRIGVIAEDSRSIGDGGSVSVVDTVFLNVKATQEINERITKLEELLA